MERNRTHDWETHGRSNEIDESTPIYKVKGPNLYVRVKEEIEAIVDTITSKKSPNPEMHVNKDAKTNMKASDVETSKVGTEEPLHKQKTHHKEIETDGGSNDIDEDTPIYKVNGPNVFERAKEEIEAIMGTIHPVLESNKSQQEKDGFWGFLAKSFAKCCYPFGGKRD